MKLYKQYKENLEIRNKINVINKEKELYELKLQLCHINSIQKEIIDSLEKIVGNIQFINKEIPKVCGVINHENKVPMKEEDAKVIKDLLITIPTTSREMIPNITSGVENINRINTDILKNASRNVDYYQQSFQSNKELIDSVKDLIDGDSTTDEEACFRRSLINTQLFCESLRIASTPMPTQSK